MRALILVLIIGIQACGFAYAQKVPTMSDFGSDQLLAINDGETVVFADKDSYRTSENGFRSVQVISFHDNGSAAELGTLVNDLKTGTWKKYDENGKLRTEANYLAGMKNGFWRVWDENGTLRFEFEYKQGKRVNTWKMYDESGELIKSETY